MSSSHVHILGRALSHVGPALSHRVVASAAARLRGRRGICTLWHAEPDIRAPSRISNLSLVAGRSMIGTTTRTLELTDVTVDLDRGLVRHPA